MLAFVHVADLFHRSGMQAVQITSTPSGSRAALAVDFEDGSVDIDTRDYEFLARPFRYVDLHPVWPAGDPA